MPPQEFKQHACNVMYAGKDRIMFAVTALGLRTTPGMLMAWLIVVHVRTTSQNDTQNVNGMVDHCTCAHYSAQSDVSSAAHGGAAVVAATWPHAQVVTALQCHAIRVLHLSTAVCHPSPICGLQQCNRTL